MPGKRKIKGHTEELVCRYNAEGMSTYQIAKSLKAHNVKIDHSSIWDYLNNVVNHATIEKYKDLHRTNPLTVDLAHKKIRLLDLNRERVDLISTLQYMKNADGTVKSKKFKTYLTGLKRLIELEVAGREEIERKPDMVALFQRIGPYAEVTDAELDRERKVIEQKLLIIRRGGSAGTTSGKHPGETEKT